MMFVRGYDTKFCDIDKDSHLGLGRNCRSNGTIAVYIGGSIFGWTSKSNHNFKSEANLYSNQRSVGFACIP
jgi:hypothetical protein